MAPSFPIGKNATREISEYAAESHKIHFLLENPHNSHSSMLASSILPCNNEAY